MESEASRSESVIDTDALSAWIGRSETREDTISARESLLLAATLDRASAPVAGDPLPPLWHWTAFVPGAPARELGGDGHPRLGGFLPPIPLPRRMWAGGRLQFHAPLPIGSAARRRTTIASLNVKTGRSGSLVFLTLEHEISTDAGLAITEAHDIVYRAAAATGSASPSVGSAAAAEAPQDAQWSEPYSANPVTLFRYSALTFNSHRIHYDLPYTSGVEGYPGLVVHGPLIATLLAESALKNTGRTLRSFAFRAVSPLFADTPFTLNGHVEQGAGGASARLWAANAEGRLAMTAEAMLT